MEVDNELRRSARKKGKAERKYIITFIVILCAIQMVDAWWNSSWQYRQAINISNTAGNLTDYQVKIELNSSNVGEHFNWSNSGKDLRFTYFNTTTDTETEIPFWIERFTAGQLEYYIETFYTDKSTEQPYCWGNPAGFKYNSTHVWFIYMGYETDGNIWLAKYSTVTHEIESESKIIDTAYDIDGTRGFNRVHSNGTLMIIFSQKVNPTANDYTKYNLSVARSYDNGTTWNIVMLDQCGSSNIAKTLFPYNATEWWIVYACDRDGDDNLWHMRRIRYYNETDTFSSPEDLFTAPGTNDIRSPFLFKDIDGMIYLYYGNSSSNYVVYRNSSDGNTWSPEKQLVPSSIVPMPSVIKKGDKYIFANMDGAAIKFYIGNTPTNLSYFDRMGDSNERTPYLIAWNDTRFILLYEENNSAVSSDPPIADAIIIKELDNQAETLEPSSTVWVKVPFLENNTNTTIYMYYGNPSADSASNFTATFNWTDDFEDGDAIDDWDSYTGWIGVSTSYAFEGTYSCNMTSDGSTKSRLDKTTGLEANKKYCVEIYDDLSTASNLQNTVMMGDDTNWVGVGVYTPQSTSNYCYASNGWTTSSLERSEGWHRLCILVGSDYSAKFYVDNTEIGSSSVLTGLAFVRLGHYKATTQTYRDNFFIAKYADPEPSVSSFGSEETTSIPPSFSITLNSPANGTTTSDPTPDFNFTVTGTESSYSCELFIDDTGYGTTTAYNNTPTIITANQSLSSGTHEWYINCTAGGVTNQSEIREITIAPTPPSFSITLNSPANGTTTSDPTPDFNFTVTGTESSYSCELFIDDTGYGTTTAYNNTPTIITANQSLSSGTHEWYINCTAGGVTNQSEIREITITITDTIPPSISFTPPTYQNNTKYEKNYIEVNVTATDNVAIDTIKICLYDDSGLITCQTSTTSPFFYNFTGLEIGKTYYINATVNDTSGNINFTETRKIILTDETPPSIVINTPESKAYNTTLFVLSTTITDALAGVDSCWYSIDDASPITFDCSSATFTTTEGIHTIKVWANDTLGNTNIEITTFTVDLTPPTIIILNPEPKEYPTNEVILRTQVTDALAGVRSCWYSIDNWRTNITYDCVSKLVVLPGGKIILRVGAKDFAGNINTMSVIFKVMSRARHLSPIYICADHICTPEELEALKVTPISPVNQTTTGWFGLPSLSFINLQLPISGKETESEPELGEKKESEEPPKTEIVYICGDKPCQEVTKICGNKTCEEAPLQVTESKKVFEIPNIILLLLFIVLLYIVFRRRLPQS